MRRRLNDALDKAESTVVTWPLSGVTFEAFAGELARNYRSARRLIPADWHAAAADELSVIEMGGSGAETQETRATEASVRGFWKAYRMHMDL